MFNNTFFKNAKFETKINTICYSWSLSVYFYRERNLTINTCKNVHRFNAERACFSIIYTSTIYFENDEHCISKHFISKYVYVMFFIFPTRMLFQKQVSVWQCIIVLLLAIFVWSLFWTVLKNILNWFYNSVFQFYFLRHGEFFNHIHFYLNYIMFKLKLATRFWENNLV